MRVLLWRFLVVCFGFLILTLIFLKKSYFHKCQVLAKDVLNVKLFS